MEMETVLSIGFVGFLHFISLFIVRSFLILDTTDPTLYIHLLGNTAIAREDFLILQVLNGPPTLHARITLADLLQGAYLCQQVGCMRVCMHVCVCACACVCACRGCMHVCLCVLKCMSLYAHVGSTGLTTGDLHS